MARPRRTCTPDFQTEAVKLVTEQGYSVAEAARSLGIHVQERGQPVGGVLAAADQASALPQLATSHPQ